MRGEAVVVLVSGVGGRGEVEWLGFGEAFWFWGFRGSSCF